MPTSGPTLNPPDRSRQPSRPDVAAIEGDRAVLRPLPAHAETSRAGAAPSAPTPLPPRPAFCIRRERACCDLSRPWRRPALFESARGPCIPPRPRDNNPPPPSAPHPRDRDDPLKPPVTHPLDGFWRPARLIARNATSPSPSTERSLLSNRNRRISRLSTRIWRWTTRPPPSASPACNTRRPGPLPHRRIRLLARKTSRGSPARRPRHAGPARTASSSSAAGWPAARPRTSPPNRRQRSPGARQPSPPCGRPPAPIHWLLPVTHPMAEPDGRVAQPRPLIRPDGTLAFQDKHAMTRSWRSRWGNHPLRRARRLDETPWCRIVISVSYDVDSLACPHPLWLCRAG